MNIETLKVFRDLSDTGSFSKTAELNYVSQTAVSQQIKKLELILKCKLYRRQGGKISLTSCGSRFYEASRKIAGIYDGALKGIIELAQEKKAEEIRISTIYSAGVYLLQNYVRKFLAHNPGVKVSVQYRQFSQIYPDIVSGRADFGFMACPYGKAAGLSLLPVANDEMVLVAGAASPLAGRKTIPVKELSGLEFVFFDRLFPSRRHIDAFLKQHGVKAVVKMELDNIDTIKTAVASGAGVSIIPRSAVREDENGKSLHVLRLADAQFLRPIYLIHSRGCKQTPALKSFISIFESPKKTRAWRP